MSLVLMKDCCSVELRGRRKAGDVLVEVVGVGAIEEDGVGEPGFVEVPGALYRDGIGGGVGEGDLVATVGFEGDGKGGVDGFAKVVGLRMREEDGLAAEVGLLLVRNSSSSKVANRERVVAAED